MSQRVLNTHLSCENKNRFKSLCLTKFIDEKVSQNSILFRGVVVFSTVLAMRNIYLLKNYLHTCNEKLFDCSTMKYCKRKVKRCSKILKLYLSTSFPLRTFTAGYTVSWFVVLGAIWFGLVF